MPSFPFLPGQRLPPRSEVVAPQRPSLTATEGPTGDFGAGLGSGAAQGSLASLQHGARSAGTPAAQVPSLPPALSQLPLHLHLPPEPRLSPYRLQRFCAIWMDPLLKYPIKVYLLIECNFEKVQKTIFPCHTMKTHGPNTLFPEFVNNRPFLLENQPTETALGCVVHFYYSSCWRALPCATLRSSLWFGP